MKKFVICHLSLVIGLALVAPVQAQRSVVVDTNGLLTAPTNFWTANSNAINAIVAGGGSGAAWISTNARTSATNLSLGWSALTNTNSLNFRSAIGLGVGSTVTFGQLLLNSSSDTAAQMLTPSATFAFESSTFSVASGTNSLTLNPTSGLSFNNAAARAATRSALDLSTWATNTNSPLFLDTNGIATASRFITTNNGGFSAPAIQIGTNATGLLAVSGHLFGVSRGQVAFSAGSNTFAIDGALSAPNLQITGSNAATSPAWYLGPAPTNGVATIATNQVGMGWDSLGRFTVQTPVMALSFYATGDPSSPTIYIPGTVVVNRLSSVFLDTQVYASNIVGGVSGGVLADSIMRDSMPSVLRNFMGGDGAAGAAGVPYILTNASMQPVPGQYFPYARVITNASSVLELEGQWLNNTNMRAAIGAEIAATNVTVTNAVTLPAARRVIATIDSGLAGSSNTITLQTNAATHGDYAEVRYVRTADNATVNVVDPFGPSTNAVMSTRSMFWSYSTNVSPARWVPVGRTIGADVVLGTLATNNSVPSAGAPTNAVFRANGTGGSGFDTRGPVAIRRTNNSPTMTNISTFTDDGVMEATVAAGVWRVEGMVIYSTANGSGQMRLLAPHNVAPPRTLSSFSSTGGGSSGFNSDTNVLWSANGAVGTNLVYSLNGLLILTNTSTIKLQVAGTSGGTNTNFATMLSNSLLFLTPL